MLSVAQAKQKVLLLAKPTAAEKVHLSVAAERILADDLLAPSPLPAWNNSAMDGVALRQSEANLELSVQGSIAAGDLNPPSLIKGHAIRIMTGAPLPQGANAVVPREEVEDLKTQVRINAPVIEHQHIRMMGSDVEKGEHVLRRGDRLGIGEITLMAGLGVTTIDVSRKPRVAILSTGSELVAIDQTPLTGQIRNTNNMMLLHMLRDAGADPMDLGHVVDDKATIINALHRGLEVDILLTTGGVSVGDFDYVKEAFQDVGIENQFWKVAMKPGKPLTYGKHADGTLVFGLPGNPVSAFVSFELFVRPLIKTMLGASQVNRHIVSARSTVEISKRPGRAHFLRARLDFSNPDIQFKPVRNQSSGALSSMVNIDALVEIPAEHGDVSTGTPLNAHLIRI